MEKAFVIGFIGSFYGYEGIDLIIKALPEILKFAPNARVLLVGGGKEEATIKKLVEQMRLQEVVAFTGRVPHSEVSRYYSLVDLLVYPRKSMRLTETVTPLKPLEAMAQGRLLAASSVGGHRELIADGETGFLFAADDPMALAVSVRRVLNSRDKWQHIRKQGRHFVESYRTWQSSAAGYVPIYKEVLHRVRHSG
jgi:glycosyltransferase involved in cell wall biosynthesis